MCHFPRVPPANGVIFGLLSVTFSFTPPNAGLFPCDILTIATGPEEEDSRRLGEGGSDACGLVRSLHRSVQTRNRSRWLSHSRTD